MLRVSLRVPSGAAATAAASSLRAASVYLVPPPATGGMEAITCGSTVGPPLARLAAMSSSMLAIRRPHG